MPDAALEKVRECLTTALPETFDADDSEDVVLVGYVIVAEWADTGGRRWLTLTAGDINDEEPAEWTIGGWLQHAMNGGTEAEEE